MTNEAVEGADVLVASFTTPLDAELARTLLDQHDIASRLEGDMLAGAALHLQSAFGGVRIMVAAGNAERARQLIDEHERQLAAERRVTDTADARVARAYALALVGLMLLPFLAHAISLFNLLRVPWQALSAKGRRRYLIGVAVDLLVIVPVAYWLVTVVSRERAEELPYLLERPPGEQPTPAQ